MLERDTRRRNQWSSAVILTLLLFAARSGAGQTSAPKNETVRAPALPLGYVEPSIASFVTRARMVALEKVRSPKCQLLLREFKDLAGHTLEEVLADREETVELHLERMVFLDGSRVFPCGRRDVFAFTSIGSLAVRVCRSFGNLTRTDMASAANLLIHEELHSLGAGEAPSPGLPTAYEITSRVEFHCGSSPVAARGVAEK